MTEETKTPSQLLGETRNRAHVAPHERHIDVQTLDALLRIEEKLIQLAAVLHLKSLPVATEATLEMKAAKKPAKGVTRL